MTIGTRGAASFVALAGLWLSAGAAAESDSGWEFSIAMPWRTFQTLRIDGGDATPAAGQFLDGDVRPTGAGITSYRVHDPLVQIEGPRLDRIAYSDVDVAKWRASLDEALGLQLNLRRPLAASETWRIGFAGSLRWFRIEQTCRGTGQAVLTRYSIFPNVWPSLSPPGGGPDPAATEAHFRDGGLLLLDSAVVGTAAVRHRIRLNLYEVAAGGFAGWQHGSFEVKLLAAPVVAVGDLDYRRTIQPGMGATGAWAGQRWGSTKTRVLLGARLGIEARRTFGRHFFAAVGADYEWFARNFTCEPVRMSFNGLALSATFGSVF